MSPRSYKLGRRQATVDETRARIVDAARDLLGDPEFGAAFTIDAVARRADVSRMTVYYQFGSRQSLLEAVYDNLGVRGLVVGLPAVFTAADRDEALRRYVYAFFHFWAHDRLVMRRARALARLDAEFEAGVRQRDERRRQICRAVLERDGGSPSADTLDLVLALTSFETFDALATDDRDLPAVISLVQDLVIATVHAAGG